MGKIVSYMFAGATAAVMYKVIEDNKMDFNMKKIHKKKMKWLKNMM